MWRAVLAIDESKETIGQVAKGTLGAVATYVTLKCAWLAVDFALSIISVAWATMSPVARYGYNSYKHARQWLPHVELTPRKIDWLHGAGSLAAGSIFGFENLSLPSIPTLLWAASVPGLFLFLRTRPNLLRRVWRIGYYVGWYLNHCVSIATKYAHSHPRAARSIGAGAMVAVAGVGTLHAFSSLVAVAIFLGTLKAAYSAVQIALMIAAVRGAVKMAANVKRAGCAVIRHADATKQRLISASGQLLDRPRGVSTPGTSFDGRAAVFGHQAVNPARRRPWLKPPQAPQNRSSTFIPYAPMTVGTAVAGAP